MTTYDRTTSQRIVTPEKMRNFLEEIHTVCKKYKLSIAHEDWHGAFIIEEYDEENIDWLFDARKGYKDNEPYKVSLNIEKLESEVYKE